jgi:hypothetical protein
MWKTPLRDACDVKSARLNVQPGRGAGVRFNLNGVALQAYYVECARQRRRGNEDSWPRCCFLNRQCAPVTLEAEGRSLGCGATSMATKGRDTGRYSCRTEFDADRCRKGACVDRPALEITVSSSLLGVSSRAPRKILKGVAN